MTTAEQLTLVFNNNFVAYFRSHAAHVNITGRNFRSDHKLLGGVYERRQAEIDKIGEILRTMQEVMPFNLQDVIADSTIPTDAIEGSADELLEAVMMDLEHLLNDFKELIVIASDEELEEISNYAQDQALDLEKSIWMLRSTLE
jgi:DNA-binding ferritin-like protein|tara:strand:+ start:235 stop:666 length:432 start_codon:yes stop_codon:yes gene_type:complete